MNCVLRLGKSLLEARGTAVDVRWTYVRGAVVVLDDCEEDGGLPGADVGREHVGVKC